MKVFGWNSQRANRSKAISFGWRAVFLVVVIFCLFTGTTPLDLIKKTIKAINGNEYTINLYASNCQTDKEDTYSRGWWRGDKAIGAPDMAPDANFLRFSDEFAAFYNGGAGNIICSGFNVNDEDFYLITENRKQTAENSRATSSVATSTQEYSIEDFTATSSPASAESYGEARDDVASSTEELIDEIINKYEESASSSPASAESYGEAREDMASSSDEVVEVMEEVEVIDENINTDDEVEVIEAISEETEIEISDEDDISSTTEEMSLLNKIKRIFSGAVAKAQESVTEKFESLEDLGKFRGAKIKFSFAMSREVAEEDEAGELRSEENTEEIASSSESRKQKAESSLEQASSTNNIASSVDEVIELENRKQTTENSLEIEIVDEDINSESEAEVIEENSEIDSEVDVIDNSEEVSLLEKFINYAKAQEGGLDNAQIIIWYTTSEISSSTDEDTRIWHRLDALTAEQMSNEMNGGYFEYAADFLETWENIENLAIKFEGVVDERTVISAYLDSVWVEAVYEPVEKIIEEESRFREALDLLSGQLTFSVGEKGELRFRYNKNEERIWETLGEILGLGNFWEDVIIEAKLFDSRGELVDLPLTIIFEEDGEFTVKLPEDMRALKPGKYFIKFYIEDNSGEEQEIFEIEQVFSWGVLAMNFNKSIYKPNEEAYIQMAVLDNLGHAVCDAEIELEIRKRGEVADAILSTKYGSIKRSEACGPKSVTLIPDYFAYYGLQEAGEYEITMTAYTPEGIREITETINVVSSLEFEVERAGPTRINPQAEYEMKIIVIPEEDFRGDLIEYAPMKFKVTSVECRITNSIERDPYGSNYLFYEEVDSDVQEKKLIWQDVDMQAGDVLEITYIFDAPDISPELFLVGPLETRPASAQGFGEARKWQIASDAVNKRARTVKFLAGTYSGNGTTGQNSDTDQTFSAFTFRLAETGVDIKNAFVIFESQFEAYTDNDVSYTGYELAFDACDTAPCASAFGTGDGQVLKDDNTVLAYDDNGTGDDESMQLRLLFDVTSEADIAAYTGGGQELEAQVGYRLEQETVANSIATAKAILVLTYTYDVDSENITNTVVYPLDSTDIGDSGSAQVHQEGDCTLGTDCPQFSYNMEIPELPGSFARLAQWSSYHEVNDNHGSTDLVVSAQTVGQSTPSGNYVHEANRAGEQATLPTVYFPSLTGFTENTAQAIEFRSYTNSGAHDHAIQGGEIFETYIASSSAATSTRTITFPLGVVFNGSSNNSGFKSANVYFAENGTATGTVKIKSAWFRIINHDHYTAAETVTASHKVGANATSSYAYEYNAGATVVSPTFRIFQIIESTNYTALEEANGVNPVKVGLALSNSDTHAGAASAELVITYTYTSEADGYMTNIELFGGQSAVAPVNATTTEAANSVLPELTGKTIRGATLLSSFLNSDSTGDVNAGNIMLLNANLSTGNPSCTPTYYANSDNINRSAELYTNVTGAMNTTDNQSYNACYTDDESLLATDGSKMNGILNYTYEWDNSAPTSTIKSAVQKINGSRIVDIGIEVDDPDDQNTRARLRFATGTACDFSNPGDPTLDETDANITATHGDPNIENDNSYQIGTIDAYIETASGSNSVYFDWLAGNDLTNVEGYYCLELTANDMAKDQAVPATSTVYIDTLKPTAPGALSLAARTGATTTLYFGATSTETNFREYIIYYKLYDGTDPDEGDFVHASTSDINLFSQLFNNEATTSIGNLVASTTYSFAIWAYDIYGNAASSSRVDITTNDAPIGVFNSVNTKQRTNGSGVVDVEIEVDDLNNQNTLKAKVLFATGTACDFSSPGRPTLDENPANITADYGLPTVENENEYQIGANGVWILTSPGSNTVTFDWLSASDLPEGDDTYCLELTVNDSFDDQLVGATTTLTIDNLAPTSTGALSSGAVTTDSITLVYAYTNPGEDTNEPASNAYKIYYKQGTFGLTPGESGETEHDNSDLNAYDYNSATSTIVSGLTQNTWYVFNIWTYDYYGNTSSATEVAIKTNATVNNESLAFTNAQAEGADTNIAIGGSPTEWNFRAVVTEANGWYALASTTLHLADLSDNTPSFDDLVFYWDQTANAFYDIGVDAMDVATLSSNSASNCSGLTCTLDFKIIFNKQFMATSTNYSAELYSGNDSGVTVHDTYNDFYQVRFPYVEQFHYRWRNDDGGE